jgi:hypothetical protein
MINSTKKLSVLLFLVSAFAFSAPAHVSLGVESGAAMGSTKVKNVEDYPDMFADAAQNGGMYFLANANFGITDRIQLKVGIGYKGQPYQFNVDSAYGFSAITDNFSTEELSTVASSYYFPAVLKFKLMKKATSPYIGIGYSYESLFKDLSFNGISGDEDFQYINSNLHLAEIMIGLQIARNDKPFLEFVFSYEQGLNNQATSSYDFLGDDFKIVESDIEFGINYYFK